MMGHQTNNATLSTLAGKALVVVIAGLGYLGGLEASWLGDDYQALSTAAHGYGDIGQMFGLAWGVFRPMYYLSSSVMYSLFGLHPVGYHVTGIVLHAINALLVCHLAALLSKRKVIGLVAGMVFAVYPRAPGAVMPLADFYYLYLVLFTVAALVLFRRYRGTGKPAYYLFALIAFVLAMMSLEPAALIVPLFLITAEYYGWHEPGKRMVDFLRDRKRFLKYLPIAGLAVLFIVVYLLLRRDYGAPFSSGYQAYLDSGQFKKLLIYTIYAMFPQIRLQVSLGTSPVTVALAVLTLGIVLALFLKGSKLARLAFTWLVVGILPFVLLIPWGTDNRYYYLAAVGFAIAAADILVVWNDLLVRWCGVHWARVGVAVPLAIYLVSSLWMVQVRVADYVSAGRIAKQLVDDTIRIQPWVPSNSKMYFVGTPGPYGEVYIFPGGIEGALRLAYGNPDLKVWLTRDETMSAAIEAGIGRTQTVQPPSGIYLWLYRDGHPVDVTWVYPTVADEIKRTGWYNP